MKRLKHLALKSVASKVTGLVTAIIGISLVVAPSTALADGHAEMSNAPQKTVVAFSGGGYHALSGAAGWMMGLMARNNNYNLELATSNIRAIGSNSGGSWFMTLGSYSDSFRKELEDPSAPTNFTSESGYMGKVWKYLDSNILSPAGPCDEWQHDQALCRAIRGILKPLFPKEEGFLDFLLSGGGQWQKVVESAVFGKGTLDRGKNNWIYFDEVKLKTLSSDRQDWMKNKDWLLAGTFLTDSPSLTYTSKKPKQVRLPYVGETTINLYADVQTVQGTPSSEQSIPSGGVPMMLAAKGTVAIDLFPAGDMNLDYDIWLNEAPSNSKIPASIKNQDVHTSVLNLNAMHAAGISSAAGGGFIDIEIMKKQGLVLSALFAALELENINAQTEITTALNGFAPAYQFYNPTLGSTMNFVADVHNQFIESQHESADTLTQTLASNKVVRLADGGFVDNTAVAQMLRYLQDTNGGTIPDGFNIVAFDDFPVDQAEFMDAKFPTGTDAAALFGLDNCTKKKCTMVESSPGNRTAGLLGLQYTGPSTQIFDCNHYFQQNDSAKGINKCDAKPLTSKLFWMPAKTITCTKEKDEIPLLYARYDDLSVNPDLPGSKVYGLNKSTAKGTLHVFSILGKAAFVVPRNKESFDCYTTMINNIVNEVKKTSTGSCNLSKPSVSGSNQCTLGDYLEAAVNNTHKQQ